jgi:hypothetical protein
LSELSPNFYLCGVKLIYALGMKGASRRAATTLGLVALALTSFLSTSPASSAEIEDELIKLPTEISATKTGVIFRNFIETFGESVLEAD